MSVVANVAINVDSRDAAAKLRQFQQQSTAASKAAVGLATATQKAGATAAKSANQFSGSSRSINSLIGTLGKLAAAYAGVRVAQSAIQAGIGRIESERRIQFLARSYGEIEQLASAAAASAAKFGESQTTANQALANAYARLRPVGVSLGDIVSTYNGFNTAARISGASSVEASNAFTQLAQALGSGALRGDEFNSIAEQVPGVLTAISKETGVAQGALRNYAADGKITADVVIRALKRIESEGANQLEEALNGPQQKIKDFQNASEDLAVAFSRELIPQMTDAVKALASALRSLEPILVGLGRVAAQVFNYIAGLANRIVDLSSGGRRAQAEIQASAEAQRATREKFGLRVLSPEARQFRQQYERNILFNFDAQERERKRAAAALPAAGVTPTGAMPPAGVTGTTGGGRSGADKAAREAERLAQEIERSLAAGRELGTQFERQIRLMDAATEIEKQRLQIQFDYEDREKQISELKSKTQQANLRDLSKEIERLQIRELDLEYLREQLSIFERIAGLDFSKTAELGKRAFTGDAGAFDPSLPDLRVSPAEQQMAKYREELAALTNPINMAVTGADAIGNAFGQAFQDIATGAKSTQEALADAFKGIGEAFIQMAAQIIAKQLAMIAFQTILKALGGGGGFSFSGAGPAQLPSGPGFAEGFNLPGFAAGGIVTRPTLAMVGEGGEPEAIIPFSKMGAAMTDWASGQSPAAAGFGQLGATSIPFTKTTERMVAERSERETVAALNNPKPLDVRYESQVINGVEYVTAEQHQKGMTQAAERGRALALSALQNSVKTRKRVGMA